MRILLILAVVVVFGALFVIDTTALLRLGFYCVSGGCGVPPMWIAGGGAVSVAFAWLLVRRRPANGKVARVKKAAPRKTPRPKAAARGKPKRAK